MADIRVLGTGIGGFRQPFSQAPKKTEAQTMLDALNTVNQNAAISQQLGIKDTQGTGPIPFLTGALGYLQRPQSAVLGALQGITGNVQEGEPTSPIERALGALFQGQVYRGSDIVGQAPADASIATKVAKTLAGLGIDIVTDPLTYVGLGKGGFLRGADLAAATEAQVGKVAGRVISTPATPRVTAPTTPGLGTSTTAARETAGGRIQLLTDQPVLPAGQGMVLASGSRGPVTATEAIAKANPVSVDTVAMGNAPKVAPVESTIKELDPFINEIATEAGRGQAIGGAKGMRNNIYAKLTERYSPEQADIITRAIVKDLTTEIKGGISVRVPFLGKDDAGNIVTTSQGFNTRALAQITPGAGYAIDAIGLGGIANKAREVYNTKYRTGRFYQGFQNNLNGATGANYAKLIKYEATNGKEGLSYKQYKDFIKLNETVDKVKIGNDIVNSETLKVANINIATAPNPKEAEDARNLYVQKLVKGEYDINPNASESEIAGYNAAKVLLDHGLNTWTEAKDLGRELGIRIPELNTKYHLPNILTPEEIAYRKIHGELATEYNPTGMRKVGFGITPEGETSLMTPNELNDWYKSQIKDGKPLRTHDVYVTDPLQLFAQSYGATGKLLEQLTAIKFIRDAELMVPGLFKSEKIAFKRNIIEKTQKNEVYLSKKLEDSLRNIQSLDPNSVEYQTLKENFDKKFAEILSNNDVINKMLSVMSDVSPNLEDVRQVGTIVDLLKQNIDNTLSTGAVISEKKLKQLASKHGFIRQKKVLQNTKDTTLVDLLPLGLDAKVRLPKGLSNMYASEAVKSSVEKLYLIDKGVFNSNMRGFMDTVFQPYYTLFKQYATIGRPGGYHIRNAQSGVLNNMLGDVSAKDHVLAAQIISESNKAKTAATNAVDNILANKPSGLSGDEHALAKYIAQLGIDKGFKNMDYEKSQLSNYILYNKLEKIKIGDHTLADVLSTASDRGVMKYNRRMETLRNDARKSAGELADSLLDPKYINLFRGLSRAELTGLQKNVNRLANLQYLHYSGDFADLQENWIRLAAYITGTRRYGLSDGGTAAGMFTKALQFDYADLSWVERDVLKNIVPFYTWTRRNLPLQFNSMLSQPGKFTRLGYATEEMQEQFTANGDTGEMAQIVPSFMRDKMGFVSNVMFKGNPLVMSLDSPAYDLNRYLSLSLPNTASTAFQQTTQSLNPALKSIIEIMTGTNTFTGAKFSKKGSKFDIPIPILTHKDAEGQTRISAALLNTMSNVLPPVGMIQRLTGMNGNDERLLTNYLATFGGVPFTTLTPTQATAELNTRKALQNDKIAQTAIELGVETSWLKSLVKQGMSKQDIIYLIENGYGRPVQ